MTDSRLPALIALRNPVMHYDWGSHEALAMLRGEPRTERPEAELWIGAHAKAPSIALLADHEEALDALLQREADAVLGERCAREFHGRLPFLLKLLAVERPLSIQIHPDAAQALAGWRDEESRGIAVTDPRRTFVDPFAKPELFVALTSAVVLHGFRSATDVGAHLRAIGLTGIARAADEAEPGAMFLEWLEQAPRVWADLHLAAALHRITDEEVRALTADLVALHPDDPAALAPLFMNAVRMAPGEGLAVEPGVPHAAMRGFGVEVMGSSDNVVRAGLTSKHCALDVFAALADLRPRRASMVRTQRDASGWHEYMTGHREFRLAAAKLVDEELIAHGFAALLVVEGTLTLRSGDEALTRGPGEACLIRGGHAARLSGTGLVFSCAVPD